MTDNRLVRADLENNWLYEKAAEVAKQPLKRLLLVSVVIAPETAFEHVQWRWDAYLLDERQREEVVVADWETSPSIKAVRQ